MPLSSPRLRRLDDALAALPGDCDAMMLAELDGYAAGVAVAPRAPAPALWLPPVWGDGDPADLFEDAREQAWYEALVVAHRDAVAAALARGPGRYIPYFEEDRRHGEILWELWIEGFAAALALDPDGWDAVAADDGQAGEALAGLTTLVAIARDESDLARDAIDALTLDAPGLIGGWVAALDQWRRAHGDAGAGAPPAPARIGRNDPCPCGSGVKHKKCCGRG